jgi:hypothetical protein
MKYWLNLYTWKTWNEFLEAGGDVSGFKDSRWRSVQKIKSGDILLCYMTGISRFFAILEVIGKPFRDETPIWEEMVFPSRLPVKVHMYLDPEYAVPVISLRSNLSYFQNMKSPHSWTGAFRGSPIEIKPADADIIIKGLEDAQINPVFREYDQRKLERKVRGYETKSGTVSIPEDDETEEAHSSTDGTTHEEIQWLLLNLGEEMGLDLWVARNDKNKSFGNNNFQSLTKLRDSLPVQFDDATNRTIELIDVLWLKGNVILAAFEIEHTSAIYSGLLRMADLISMQPNINIPLFIVAPDERREKVQKEINRPVFSTALNQPLPEICRYISYSALQEKIQQARAGGFLRYLRPEFLDEIAEDVAIDD